jgi:hypothetical protein
LLSNGRHLLQEGLILIISTVCCESTGNYIHGALGKYDFMYAKTWFGIKFAKCLTYVARCPGASFKRSTSGAIFGPPRCGTSSLAKGSAATSSSFNWPHSFSQSSLSFCRDL